MPNRRRAPTMRRWGRVPGAALADSLCPRHSTLAASRRSFLAVSIQGATPTSRVPGRVGRCRCRCGDGSARRRCVGCAVCALGSDEEHTNTGLSCVGCADGHERLCGRLVTSSGGSSRRFLGLLGCQRSTVGFGRQFVSLSKSVRVGGVFGRAAGEKWWRVWGDHAWVRGRAIVSLSVCQRAFG